MSSPNVCFIATCGLRVLVYKLQEDNIYRTWRTWKWVYDIWLCLKCLHCTRPHTSVLLQMRTLSVTLLCCFMCSAFVHTEHMQARSKHCGMIWVWTEAEMAEERYSEVPVWDGWQLLQFRFLSLAFISVIHILKVMWCKVFNTLIFFLLIPMFSFPASMMSSHAFPSSCLSLSFSHLSPDWLLCFSLFHLLCLPPPSLFLAVEEEGGGGWGEQSAES